MSLFWCFVYCFLLLLFWRADGGLFTDSAVLELTPLQLNRDFIDRDTVHEALLLNLYSSSCGHCVEYSKKWKLLADEVNRSCKNTVVMSLDCDEYRDVCTSYGVDTVPTLLGFKRRSDLRDRNESFELTEVTKDTLAWITNVDKHCIKNTVLPKTQNSEEDVEHMNLILIQDNRLLGGKDLMKREISMAARFGLEKGVFLGRKELNQAEHIALFLWLNVLRQSLPGSVERGQISWLFSKLKQVSDANDQKLTSRDFDDVVSKWSFAKYADNSEKWQPKWILCQNSLSAVHGGFPCALWMLFHVLSVSSSSGGASTESTLHAIHGYIEHFFGCNECRLNFLQSNPNPIRDVVQLALKYHIPPARSVLLWLWNEHNSVSLRLTSKGNIRPIFPSKDLCYSCYIIDSARLRGGPDNQNDQTYPSGSLVNLTSPNARFRDVLKVEEGTDSLASWNYDTVEKFLLHTYCFDDSRLHCPKVTSTISAFWAALAGMISKIIWYLLWFALLFLAFVAMIKARQLFRKRKRKSRRH